MRYVFLSVGGGLGLCLQLINCPVLAQTVAIPATTIVCAPPACPQTLVRMPNGVLVYAPSSNPSLAADAPAGGSNPPPATAGPPVQPPTVSPNFKTFGGLNLGVGIGATFDPQNQRVSSATAVNNIVRVTQTNNATISLVGESHYFFIPNTTLFGVPAGDWGTGPFVAIDAGTNNGNNVVAGYSIGWMIGFRQVSSWVPDPNKPQNFLPTYSSTSSWNFGLGFRVDPNAQVLGDGVAANRPLPPGETTVRLKTEPIYGIMLLSSFSF
jgi:hypothetical protein